MQICSPHSFDGTHEEIVELRHRALHIGSCDRTFAVVVVVAAACVVGRAEHEREPTSRRMSQPALQRRKQWRMRRSVMSSLQSTRRLVKQYATHDVTRRRRAPERTQAGTQPHKRRHAAVGQRRVDEQRTSMRVRSSVFVGRIANIV